MFSKILKLILIMPAIIIIGIAVYLNVNPITTSSFAGAGNEAVVNPSGVPTRELAILFIGNSYTFVNDLPAILVNIAKSDTDNHTRFNVKSVTRGGAFLRDLLKDGEVTKQLHARHWDYIVLQEQSLCYMYYDCVSSSMIAVRQFSNTNKNNIGKILFYNTWARQNNTHWYSDAEFKTVLRSYTYMQQQLDINTKKVADNIGASVIPVGDYWFYVLTKKPEIILHSSDGSHPSPAGSYLAALLFYRYLAGYKPVHADYVPMGVPDEQASFLKGLVTR